VNQEIFANTVRVIGNNGEQLGVFTIEKALGVAEEASLDLVEISPNAEPPVCKVMDFGKYQYEQKKQLSDAKKKQKKTTVKMIKYRPSTEEGDYQIKFRNLTKFLDNGDKVKVVIWFRGREMQHRELGMEMLERIEKDTEEFATVEQKAKLEGRQLGMMLAPKSRK
jgi:translation initiation factor IF-3